MLLNRVAMVGILVAVFASTASADWHSFWHRFHIDYHRNNAWPHPFREVAAAQTRMPFEVQRANGWQLHNTVSHGFFREGDGQLNYAGQQQLLHIMTQVPERERTVFVVRGATPTETEARIDSVRSSLERYSNGQTTVPQIVLVDRAPATSSGALAAAINRQWMEVLPEPVLTQDNSTPQVSSN